MLFWTVLALHSMRNSVISSNVVCCAKEPFPPVVLWLVLGVRLVGGGAPVQKCSFCDSVNAWERKRTGIAVNYCKPFEADAIALQQ